MNLLDIIIIGTMFFLILRGTLRGFFREVGSLAGIILGVWFATAYYGEMTGYLKAYIPSVKFLPMISFGVIFIFVFVICNLGGWGLKLTLKKAFLGWADRALGAGLAILKGVLIAYLGIVLLTFFLPKKAPLIAGSKLAPVIISSYQTMVGLISPGSYDKWKREFLGHKAKALDRINRNTGAPDE